MDLKFLYLACAVMLIIIGREILKNRFNIDLDNIDITKLKKIKKPQVPNTSHAINKTTGVKTLVLVDVGANKATVMATLRQITGMDYNSAKNIVNSTPSVFMSNVSDKEADLNKKALEFVGAKVEIK